MNAGLEASTVTPGSTAPPSSRTTPAMVPLDASCAADNAGTARRINTARIAAGRNMKSSLRRLGARRAYSFTLARSLAILTRECNGIALTEPRRALTFPRMPTSRTHAPLCPLIASLLLVFASAPAFAQGAWKNVAPFPEPREELLGAAAGGQLYVFAGLIPLWHPAGVVHEYDAASDQ